MARATSLSQWVSENTVVAAGAFMSGIFLLVGLAGSLASLPGLSTWHAAATWPTATAEITANGLVSAGIRRTVRPDFTFRYTWEDRVYTARGYDLLEVYSSNLAAANAVLKAHPVGSQTPVLVNPAAPGQAVLTRGDTGTLLFRLMPLLFAGLGLVGGAFTAVGWLGWLEPESKHPVGRAVRAVGARLLQEKVLKVLLFIIVGGVIVGLVGFGIKSGNDLLVLSAGVVAWGFWRASRKRPAGDPD